MEKPLGRSADGCMAQDICFCVGYQNWGCMKKKVCVTQGKWAWVFVAHERNTRKGKEERFPLFSRLLSLVSVSLPSISHNFTLDRLRRAENRLMRRRSPEHDTKMFIS